PESAVEHLSAQPAKARRAVQVQILRTVNNYDTVMYMVTFDSITGRTWLYNHHDAGMGMGEPESIRRLVERHTVEYTRSELRREVPVVPDFGARTQSERDF